ncbi:MarR family transcriptional regulator, transcriptional regulator for hemolysin [Faunimonas pinastri]|uniref:MarR family transcriptional regulator, transcriptional regulator for hemolysin n=1 Tax=Faunimonas pinastri TaxID=1855383 RepID=A0A1H9K9F0_9HYPH|nr:MarR family transcriptional regulator [Faunimonas pinastri]SEQ95688.1 MarR family transcriptional regulator, transcriptional regulator for hemolysin [Faunimonas pinastri]
MAPSQAHLYAFTNAIQPVRRAWLQAAAVVAAENGVSFSVATAILHLSRMGSGLQQSALAEEAGVNPAAMLRTLDQAEAAGLIERRAVAGDRRVKAIHLLAAGEAIAIRLESRLAELRADLLHDVPSAEVQAATRLLRLFETRIIEHLQKPKSARGKS